MIRWPEFSRVNFIKVCHLICGESTLSHVADMPQHNLHRKIALNDFYIFYKFRLFARNQVYDIQQV